MKRPRILFVSPRFPFPLNSGTKIRISQMLQALSDIGSVDLACYCVPWEFKLIEEQSEMLPFWWQQLNSIQAFEFPAWPIANIGYYHQLARRHVLAKKDLFYTDFPAKPMLSRMAHLAREADLIWVERLYMAQSFGKYCKKIVVDLDDLESAKIHREASTAKGMYTRFALRREAKRLTQAERESTHRFAGVAVCSPEDTSHFGEHAPQAWVVPNGVDDALIDLPRTTPEKNHLVFVGTMNYWPNEQAVLYFHQDILPRIQAEIPDVVLSIVGLKPPPSICSLHDGKSVFVHPDVPEIAPYVQRASLSIVPLKVGGGTRLKILESLALGTPVVSTTVGAEGLDLADGEHLVLADQPDDFARAVIRLLTDSNFNHKITAQGLERVRERYLWSSIRKQVQEKCAHLLQSLPEPGPRGIDEAS